MGAGFEIYQLMLNLASDGIAIVMALSELREVLGVSNRMLVIGEGRLRCDFVKGNLTQDTLMGAALAQPLR